MSIEQIRFLGSSIMNFNASIGWGSQESRLQVGLVDDVKNGDGFNPPDVGAPVYFDYQGWKFQGLLEHYGRDRSPNGNPVYDVSVVDPRVLLDGVQVILSDYYGVAPIPNILNVFGYLEFIYGFGGSQRNDSGIPYGLVSAGIMTLADGGFLNYGSPISYKGYAYGIDLTALPLLPAYYRISAQPSISIMEFVNEICEAGACEYFFTLEGSTIVLHTVSRSNIPLRGVITQFVDSVEGCVSTSAGLDMVNETCSKMLIGGPITDILFDTFGTGPDGAFLSSKDNPIWYYWGTDNDGNLITSDGPNQDFSLDSRSVLIRGIGDTYPTDIGEMRAALASQDSWETYLWYNCFNEFEFDADGDQIAKIFKLKTILNKTGGLMRIDFVEGNVQYKHSGYPNPHFRKAYDIGINPTMDFNIVNYLLGTPSEVIIAANLKQLLYERQAELANLSTDTVDDMSKLYGLINSYANEHYGLKFMVMLPDVKVKQDIDTGEFFFSHDIADAGYLTEDVIANATDSNMMPWDNTNVTTQDGRIMAYVRFDNIEGLNMRDIRPEDLMFGKNLIKNAGGGGYQGTNSIFVRCTVDDKMVFLDNQTFTSPRAVITLSSRVFVEPDSRYADRILYDYITRAGRALVDDVYTPEKISKVMKKFMNSSFGDTFNIVAMSQPVIPAMVAVPLKSNIYTYGPWFAAGANGKVEVEQAEDLVPWNYDGYTALNLAANARVSLAIANMQWVESGGVEFPGAPLNQLGTQLLNSGPYVTDIHVQASVGGVTTSYAMKSWNPQYGRAAKASIDKLGQLARANQQIKRNLKQNIKLNTFKNTYLNIKNQLPNIQ